MGTRLVTSAPAAATRRTSGATTPTTAAPDAWRDLCAEMPAAILPIAERHDVDLGIEPELANVVDSAAAGAAS